MKKQNIRVRRNSGSKSASSQVPNKPDATHRDREEITMEFQTPKGESIDCCELTDAESETVRIFTRTAKVSLAELVKASLLNHIHTSIAAAKPVAPVVAMPEQKAEPLKRQSVIGAKQPDMESAMHYATGLLALFASLDCSLTERSEDKHHGSISCGLQAFVLDMTSTLHTDCYAAYDHKGGDKVITIKRLGITVAKARALLLMLAHDLSGCGNRVTGDAHPQLGNDLPDVELSPYLSLAADCVEYLEASFYDGFGRHLPMDNISREISEELLQRFVQPTQQRRAA